MPIAINSEHVDLADSVRSLIQRVVPAEVLHAALETPVPTPPQYWKSAADQGLHGVLLSEAAGGQGFGILELAVVLAEFGYGAVPGPFVPSAIASALISAHDPIAAYAIDSGLTATKQGGGDQDKALVIRGEVRAVPAAAQASILVLPVAIESGEEWVVLDAADLEIESVESVDPLRPVANVRANAVEIGADRLLSNLSRDDARALMCTLLSAEAIGVARWATDTASEYAKIREQFGRPIGQFQAVKHKCAQMIALTERATAAVWDAARAIDDARAGDPNAHVEFAAAVAATLAPDAADLAALQHDDASVIGVVDTATSTGMRGIDIDLDPETEKVRDEIRAEVTALKAIPSEQRNVALAEGGWVMPHMPKPWGRAAKPIEQIIIAQEFATGRVKRPNVGIAVWIIPSVPISPA